MQFRPLHDRVVIEPLDREEKTVGGIIVPDTAQEKPMRGKVLVTGPGARDGDGALVPNVTVMVVPAVWVLVVLSSPSWQFDGFVPPVADVG